MQSYEGYFENGKIYLFEPLPHMEGRRRVIITILDEPPLESSKLPIYEIDVVNVIENTEVVQ